MDFTGKHVVITGANRGIGLGVAEGFLKSGARFSSAGLGLPEDVATLQ